MCYIRDENGQKVRNVMHQTLYVGIILVMGKLLYTHDDESRGKMK